MMLPSMCESQALQTLGSQSGAPPSIHALGVASLTGWKYLQRLVTGG